MTGSQSSQLNPHYSSLELKSTSQDEYLYNLGYDPILAEENKEKVKSAICELENKKPEYVEISLSKTNILSNIVGFLNKKKENSKQEIINEEKLTEEDRKAFEKVCYNSKNKRKTCDLKNKRVKDKSFFSKNFCGSWD